MSSPLTPTEQLKFSKGLTCLACGEHYSFEQLKAEQGTTMVNICYNACFGPLDLTYDYEAIKAILTPEEVARRPDSFWRLAELLPVNEIRIPDRPYTPLIKSKAIGPELGIELYFKLDMDSANPTCSFKDRPITLAFNKALELGYDTVFVASTGNLAISTAYFARQFGLSCRIYIPRSLGEVKKSAIRAEMASNAELLELDLSYDECNARSLADCQKFNEELVAAGKTSRCFVPNNSFRPYYKEGSKTSGYEIAFQIEREIGSEREVNLVYPIGSGALLCGANKGIQELKKLGLWSNPHKIWGVQPESCAPVIQAWAEIQSGKNPTEVRITPVLKPDTIVRSIAIGNPGSGYQTLDILAATGGGGWSVSETTLVTAEFDLIQREGIFPQFVGGTVLAGIRHGVATGELAPGSIVVANLTGVGTGRIEDDLKLMADKYGIS